jgi:hypothetical protein
MRAPFSNQNAARKIDAAIRRGWVRDLPPNLGPCRFLHLSRSEQREELAAMREAKLRGRWGKGGRV